MESSEGVTVVLKAGRRFTRFQRAVNEILPDGEFQMRLQHIVAPVGCGRKKIPGEFKCAYIANC